MARTNAIKRQKPQLCEACILVCTTEVCDKRSANYPIQPTQYWPQVPLNVSLTLKEHLKSLCITSLRVVLPSVVATLKVCRLSVVQICIRVNATMRLSIIDNEPTHLVVMVCGQVRGV